MPPTLSRAALEELIAELRTVDREQPGTGLSALERLVHGPEIVLRLSRYARSWVRAPGDEWLSGDTPVALALASLERDGHVREAAVRGIAARPHPALAPFLVLRTGDWVPQVREPARAALSALLVADPQRYVPAMLPIALRTAGQQRTSYALAQVRTAARRAPEELRREFAASRRPELRRLAFEAGLADGRLTAADLLALALRESEPLVRSAAARLVADQALGGRDAGPLHYLTAAQSADVRAIAFAGLVRLGRSAAAIQALEDVSPLVRAIARDAARRAGIDAAAFYRAALAAAEPSAAAIAGLAELRHSVDAARLEPLLRHPSATVRAASLRALVQLDAVRPKEVVPLVRDPAAAVVREAALALRPFAGGLPAGLADELTRDPRPEVRRAGYRLAGTDPVEQFRAAALMALDQDPQLAARGRMEALQFQNWGDTWHRVFVHSTPQRKAALIAQLERSRPALGEKTDVLLAAVRAAVDV